MSDKPKILLRKSKDKCNEEYYCIVMYRGQLKYVSTYDYDKAVCRKDAREYVKAMKVPK